MVDAADPDPHAAHMERRPTMRTRVGGPMRSATADRADMAIELLKLALNAYQFEVFALARPKPSGEIPHVTLAALGARDDTCALRCRHRHARRRVPVDWCDDYHKSLFGPCVPGHCYYVAYDMVCLVAETSGTAAATRDEARPHDAATPDAKRGSGGHEGRPPPQPPTLLSLRGIRTLPSRAESDLVRPPIRDLPRRKREPAAGRRGDSLDRRTRVGLR
ncbi:hypothetical protein GCM10009657_41100 [Oryzihumus leptocrescens]